MHPKCHHGRVHIVSTPGTQHAARPLPKNTKRQRVNDWSRACYTDILIKAQKSIHCQNRRRRGNSVVLLVRELTHLALQSLRKFFAANGASSQNRSITTSPNDVSIITDICRWVGGWVGVDEWECQGTGVVASLVRVLFLVRLQPKIAVEAVGATSERSVMAAQNE